MSEKHDAFVRLSEKRLENVEDAIRIWSNLSGPSYQFTIDEVMAGVERIIVAAANAKLRFSDTKCWREQDEDPRAEPDTEDVAEGAAAEVPPAAESNGITPRQAAMLRIWDEAGSEQGALIEMLAMQQEVINHLQSLLIAKGSA